MRVSAFAGLTLLLVAVRQGACKMVNLTAVAEGYLNETVEEGWKSWGLDGSYEYWTGRHFTKHEHKIKGSVDGFQQDDKCKDPLDAGNKVCKERFIWMFEQGIWSPFQLLVNVTVKMLEGGNETFELDLNNATTVVKPQLLGLNAMRVATTKHKTCPFNAQVSFEGWFAYKIKDKRGDVPDYYGVGIGKLSDTKYGLVGDGAEKLRFNMTGSVKRLLVCTNQIKKKRKKTPRRAATTTTTTTKQL
uniref:DA-P36 family member n=1 Tax=Rhipicephalus zambeziensis TaxID=60191 RepID=A0A224Y358_9ACAR